MKQKVKNPTAAYRQAGTWQGILQHFRKNVHKPNLDNNWGCHPFDINFHEFDNDHIVDETGDHGHSNKSGLSMSPF
jgi:hypothetical protein